MSYQVVLETVDGETKVTLATGAVPARITIGGHVAEPGTSPPAIYASDGTITANASVHQ